MAMDSHGTIFVSVNRNSAGQHINKLFKIDTSKVMTEVYDVLIIYVLHLIQTILFI